MNAHRPAVATVAALALFIGAVGVSPAAAQNLNRVEQGGAVYVEGTGYCTVGYNDPAHRRSLVAAHCGDEGARVRIVDHATRTGSEFVGTIHRSKKYDGRLGNDWAAIEWDGGVSVGGNRFSGDAWVRPGDVSAGERVCYFGQSSNRSTGRPTCGTYAGNVNNTFFVDATLTHPGDSGGPMWVPGRGFVGVVSSMWATTPGSVPGNSDYVVGVLPEDGPAVSDLALLGLFMGNMLLPPAGSAVGPFGDALRTMFSQFFGFIAALPITLPGIINYA